MLTYLPSFSPYRLKLLVYSTCSPGCAFLSDSAHRDFREDTYDDSKCGPKQVMTSAGCVFDDPAKYPNGDSLNVTFFGKIVRLVPPGKKNTPSKKDAPAGKRLHFQTNRLYSKCRTKITSKLDPLQVFTPISYSCTGFQPKTANAERLAPLVKSGWFSKDASEKDLKEILDRAVT